MDVNNSVVALDCPRAGRKSCRGRASRRFGNRQVANAARSSSRSATPVNSGKPLTGGGLVTNQLLEAEGEAGL